MQYYLINKNELEISIRLHMICLDIYIKIINIMTKTHGSHMSHLSENVLQRGEFTPPTLEALKNSNQV